VPKITEKTVTLAKTDNTLRAEWTPTVRHSLDIS